MRETRESFNTDIHRKTHRDGRWEWCSYSSGEVATRCWKNQGLDFPLKPLDGGIALLMPSSQSSGLLNNNWIHLYCDSHHMYGNLLQQPQQTNKLSLSIIKDKQMKSTVWYLYLPPAGKLKWKRRIILSVSENMWNHLNTHMLLVKCTLQPLG